MYHTAKSCQISVLAGFKDLRNSSQRENEIETDYYFYLNIFHYPLIINPIKQHEKRETCFGWIVLNKESGSGSGS